MSQIGLIPFYRAVDSNGNPIPNARLYTFLTGTLTPQATFTDEDLTTPHGPYVQADANGLFPAFYPDPTLVYRYQLRISPYTSAVSGYDADPVGALSASSITFLQDGAGAVLRTLEAKLRENAISVKDFGAVGDSVAIEDEAVNRAITAANALASANGAGAILYFPPGIYLLNNSDLQVNRHGTTTTVALADGVGVYMDDGAWLKATDLAGGTTCIFFTCDGNNDLRVNIDGDEYLGSMTGAWTVRQGYGVFSDSANSVRVVDSHIKNVYHGIQIRGGERLLVVNSEFTRMRGSGVLLLTTGGGAGTALRHNEVLGCNFKQMGDTAVAFVPANNSKEVAFNTVANCTAENTNYRTQGFAFDVEGGFAFGLYHDNKFIGNTTEQNDPSSQGQGGATMNLYSEDSAIVGNVFRSSTAFLGDIGISIPGGRRVLVANNQVSGFRANGVYAEGAVRPVIRDNVIHNCGDGSGAGGLSYSTILLAYADNSTAPTVEDNTLSWDDAYAYAGANAEGIFANMGTAGKSVTDVSICNNVLRSPLGGGIRVRGFATAGFQPKNIIIDSNRIFGNGASGIFDGNPIAARYCIGLSVQNNRIFETENGIDLTGSTNGAIRNNYLANYVTSPTVPYWLDVTSSDLLTVEGNKFSTAVTTKIVTTSATNLTIRYNEGYKTENFGTSAAIATGATIDHGLDVTPTFVSLTANAAAAVKVGAQVDATNITVTHDSGGSTAFFWQARG